LPPHVHTFAWGITVALAALMGVLAAPSIRRGPAGTWLAGLVACFVVLNLAMSLQQLQSARAFAMWGAYLFAFIYCAGTGIRLARFNANISVVDKRYFQGLPSPSGAAVMAGLVWVLTDFGFDPDEAFWLPGLTWVFAVFAGITMVSNVPFWSFKEVNWKKRVPLWVILACVIGFSIVASSPSLVLFLLFFSYSLSGYVMWAMGHRVRPVLPEE